MTSMTAEQEIAQKALDRDANAANLAANLAAQAAAKAADEAHQLATAKINQRAAAVTIARDMLNANAASKAVEEREVTAADITAYAATLYAYVLGDDA